MGTFFPGGKGNTGGSCASRGGGKHWKDFGIGHSKKPEGKRGKEENRGSSRRPERGENRGGAKRSFGSLSTPTVADWSNAGRGTQVFLPPVRRGEVKKGKGQTRGFALLRARKNPMKPSPGSLFSTMGGRKGRKNSNDSSTRGKGVPC